MAGKVSTPRGGLFEVHLPVSSKTRNPVRINRFHDAIAAPQVSQLIQEKLPETLAFHDCLLKESETAVCDLPSKAVLVRGSSGESLQSLGWIGSIAGFQNSEELNTRFTDEQFAARAKQMGVIRI